MCVCVVCTYISIVVCMVHYNIYRYGDMWNMYVHM